MNRIPIKMNTKGPLNLSSIVNGALSGRQTGAQGIGQIMQQFLGNQQNFGQMGQQNFGNQQSFGQMGQQNFGTQQNFGNQQSFGQMGQQDFGTQQSFGQMGQQNFGNQQNFGQMNQQNFGQMGQQDFGTQQNFGQTGQQNFGNQQNFGQMGQQNFGTQAAPQQAGVTRQRPAGNGVVLRKGQKTSLKGTNGQGLTNLRVCLGWDINNNACDLDVSAFLLGADGRIIGDDWFVFYGQTLSPDGAVRHSGDSSGEAMGDDEVIDINLNQLNPNVSKITFVVTIDRAMELGLNFSMVSNAYARIVDSMTNMEIGRFNLTEYYSNVTAMVVGEVYRYNNEWKFNPVGDGVSKDLAGLCGMYGVNISG